MATAMREEIRQAIGLCKEVLRLQRKAERAENRLQEALSSLSDEEFNLYVIETEKVIQEWEK